MNRPIIEMFWVAEYFDGTALAQLDPINRVENSFGTVFHKKVKRFWWIPVTPKMALIFPGTRFNPRLRRCAVELKGSKGFVARRTIIELGMGSVAKSTNPSQRIKCYVLGIEGGPRREIYPDGSIISREWPTKGETQDILHGG
jgi:hypothetical protein